MQNGGVGHGFPKAALQCTKYGCHSAGGSTQGPWALRVTAVCFHLCLKVHHSVQEPGLRMRHSTRPEASFQVEIDSHTEGRQIGVGLERSSATCSEHRAGCQNWETKEKASVIPHTAMVVLQALFTNDSKLQQQAY